MPEYLVTDPDSGKKFKLSGDSPPSEQELGQIFKPETKTSRESVQFLPGFLSFDSEETAAKRDELFKKNPEQYLSIMQRSQIEGFNQGLINIGQGLKQATLESGEFLGITDPKITGDYTKSVQEQRERYEETYGLFPGSKVTRFIGDSAPYSYLPIKMPAGLFQKIGVGGAFGAGVAGTQFVDEGDSRALNIAAGMTVGVAIPAIGAGLGQTLKWANQTLKEPFEKGAAYKDVAKFLSKHITENRDKIETAIESSIHKGENKTIAQIIADATRDTGDDFGGLLVRLERDLSRESDVLKSIYAMQSEARKGIINNIAGLEDDLIKAVTRRSNNAALNYKKAFEVPIAADPDLVKLSQNKYFQVAMQDAKDLAQVKGVDTKKNLTEFLHYVKEGLDKQLNATDAMGKTALGREELRAVGKLKEELVKWIGKKNTYYDSARMQFQADSVPVNRMEIGQELKRAYINALDQEKPAMFASAVENAKKTIKKATGVKGKFEDILTTKQVEGLEALKNGLIVEAKKKRMAAESKPILAELIGDTTVSLPHILSRPIVITNHILRMLGKDKTPEYKTLLVDMVRNPHKFLEAYRLPEKEVKGRMAIDIVQKLNIIIASEATTETINE